MGARRSRAAPTGRGAPPAARPSYPSPPARGIGAAVDVDEGLEVVEKARQPVLDGRLEPAQVDHGHVSILTRMPPQPEAARAAVELLELRVLDGPNRFFNRPAVKLEFVSDAPGAAAEVAAAAGLAVRRLHTALDLAAPRVTSRHSVDHPRPAIA